SMATSSSPQSDQTLKVEDEEEELADITSTTILMGARVHDEL
ncbi:hypothetical protein Tco_1486719, partial [Tanacetum coccineum]